MRHGVIAIRDRESRESWSISHAAVAGGSGRNFLRQSWGKSEAGRPQGIFAPSTISAAGAARGDRHTN
jgi:hypothetical protein